MADPETETARRDVWLRGLFMLIFVVLFGIGQWLLNLIAVFQFLWLLFSSHTNPNLVAFGRSLAKWLATTARFQCGDSEEKPFPWAPWPTSSV